MNEKNLEKLKQAILSELDCNIGDFFPSQNGIDITDRNGHEFSCLIDFRSSKRFNDDIYSFSDDYLKDLKAVNGNKNQGLIIVCDKNKINRLFIINPNNPLVLGFNHLESYNEFGEKQHHFIKLCGKWHNDKHLQTPDF